MSVEGKTKNIENSLKMLEIIAQLHKGIEVEMELHVQELLQDGNDQCNKRNDNRTQTHSTTEI